VTFNKRTLRKGKTMSILSVQNLSLSFGGLKVLSNVSFDVNQGEVFAIIGPNGAGKTSILNIISGFYRPSMGRVFLEGNDITSMRTDRRAGQGLGRTFQNIALYRGMSVLDNVKLGAHTHLKAGLFSSLWYWGSAHREEMNLRRKLEDEIIDFLEMESIRKRPVGSLAYGLQKRVELARALAMQPKILLMDEPVAGMNAEETEDMARFILDLNEERNITVVLIEHDMKMIMDISRRVLVLNFGMKLAEGKPDEVQNHPEVIKAYLGEKRTGDGLVSATHR
jgi:branched-chain amino acid transport system ATP-binding protein